MNIEKYRQYLPSKKFQKILGSIVIVIVVIILISLVGSGKIHITQKQKEQAVIQKMTLSELVQKDTDNDGSPDWEEGLFGTDPKQPISNKQGIPDGEYINNQKKAQGGGDTSNLTETDKAAQDFFIAIEALKQSDNLTPTALYNITSSISQTILSEKLPETYAFSDVKTTENNKQNQKKYMTDFKKIHSDAIKKGLGKELGVFMQALGEGNRDQLASLSKYADIYKNMSVQLKNIQTPEDLSTNHYLLINHYERIGISLNNISESFENPTKGMIGVAGYKKWTEESNTVLKDIQDLFKQYGIL